MQVSRRVRIRRRRRRRRRFVGALGALLLLVGAGVVSFAGGRMLRSYVENRRLVDEVDAMLADRSRTTRTRLPGERETTPGDDAGPPPALEPGLLGRLEIPRLGVRAAILEGTDESSLSRGAGFFPETSLPSAGGNTALAGHRDSVFRSLADVEAGDEITLATAAGVFRYRVEGTEVVDPADVSILDPTPSPQLTLVTCYPFDWVGPAPQRYVVYARRVDDDTLASARSGGRRSAHGRASSS